MPIFFAEDLHCLNKGKTRLSTPIIGYYCLVISRIANTTALNILRNRYASGEVTEQEYKAQKTILGKG